MVLEMQNIFPEMINMLPDMLELLLTMLPKMFLEHGNNTKRLPPKAGFSPTWDLGLSDLRGPCERHANIRQQQPCSTISSDVSVTETGFHRLGNEQITAQMSKNEARNQPGRRLIQIVHVSDVPMQVTSKGIAFHPNK